MQNRFCFLIILWFQRVLRRIIRYVWTYSNIFSMVIPNIVVNFNNVDISDLSSAHACHVITSLSASLLYVSSTSDTKYLYIWCILYKTGQHHFQANEMRCIFKKHLYELSSLHYLIYYATLNKPSRISREQGLTLIS